MPLHVDLKLNEDNIVHIRAERIVTDVAGWHTYEWTLKRLQPLPTSMGIDNRQEVTGKVVHQHAEGAVKLLSSVLDSYYRDVAHYEYEHKHMGNPYG